jgi:hypothetical protein
LCKYKYIRWPKIKSLCHLLIPMCLYIMYRNVVMMNSQVTMWSFLLIIF